ncbi:MAG: hypothetical protein Kow0069_15830 [Promethearchaeota archaeon]
MKPREEEAAVDRNSLNYYFNGGALVVGVLMVVPALSTGETYAWLSASVGAVGGAGLVLTRMGRNQLAGFLGTAGISFLLFVRAASIRSTFNICAIPIVLVVAGVVLSWKYLALLFSATLVALLALVAGGTFTLHQPVDPDTGLYLANTATVPLALLVFGFFVAVGINGVVVRTLVEPREKHGELVRAKNKLVEQERLKSLQVLAGGVAHDFNNLLTAIMLGLDALNGELGSPAEGSFPNEDLADRHVDTGEFLITAREAALKARELARALMSFSRGSDRVQLETIHDVGSVVRDVAQVAALRRGVELAMNVEDDLWPVRVDVTQFTQVVQNLLLNALEATTERKGEGLPLVEVRVRNARDPGGEGEGKAVDLPRGPHVVVEIMDNGPELHPEVLQQVFKPFFSTKAKGTGLGLAIVAALVRNWDAVVDVATGPGGTTFYVYLPAKT